MVSAGIVCHSFSPICRQTDKRHCPTSLQSPMMPRYIAFSISIQFDPAIVKFKKPLITLNEATDGSYSNKYSPISYSTLAPAIEKILSSDEQTDSLRLSDELRTRIFTSIAPFSAFTTARFDEDSTVPGKSFNILMTPFWQPSTALIRSS